MKGNVITRLGLYGTQHNIWFLISSGEWQSQYQETIASRIFKTLWLNHNWKKSFILINKYFILNVNLWNFKIEFFFLYFSFIHTLTQTHTNTQLHIGPKFSDMQSCRGMFDVLETSNVLKYDELYLFSKKILTFYAVYYRSPQLSFLCQTYWTKN